MNQQNGEEALSSLIRQGGVYYDVPGNSFQEALTTIINAVVLPTILNRSRLLEAVLEREALMPTALGKGIALPHPRTPLIEDPKKQFVSIAFLKKPVNWNALDGQGVDTVILIVSASAKLHLHTLSEVNFFCQQEQFYSLLKGRASLDEIIGFIRDKEQAWSGL